MSFALRNVHSETKIIPTRHAFTTRGINACHYVPDPNDLVFKCLPRYVVLDPGHE